MRQLFTYADGWCACETHFGPLTDYDTVSILTCDILTSDTCTIDEYVIDWYKDSIATLKKFTTGVGADPDIVYTHPFVGASSIPVEGGTWIPKIRYIKIDGSTYIPRPGAGSGFCELPTFVVSSLSCSNGGAGMYSHSIGYSAAINNVSEAYQSIRMNLEPNQYWIAIRLNGGETSDRFRVYYINNANNTETQIEDIVVGQDFGASNFNSTPRLFYGQTYYFVVNLSSFTISSGDYLRIDVIPSYVSGGANTIWSVQLKCGGVNVPFNCLSFTHAMQVIDASTITASWNASSCQYEFDFNLTAVGPSNSPNDSQYLNLWHNWSYAQCPLNLDTAHVYFPFSQSAYFEYIKYPVTTPPYLAAQGVITFSYTNSTHTFVASFTTDFDYLHYKQDILDVQASPYWINYSSDPTNINYYKCYHFRCNQTYQGLGCGDAMNTFSVFMYYTSQLLFNDVLRTITVIMSPPPSNGLTQQQCNNAYDKANSLINYVTTSYNENSYSRTNYCIYPKKNAFTASYVDYYPSFGSSMEMFSSYSLDTSIHARSGDMCNYPSPFTSIDKFGANALVKAFYKIYVVIVIYPYNTPIPLAVANYEMYSRIADDGSILSYFDARLIYKKLAGVVIQPWVIGSAPYAINAMVINAGKAWKSLQNNNNQEPIAESAYWTKISSI
jgi:hypothetical protein